MALTDSVTGTLGTIFLADATLKTLVPNGIWALEEPEDQPITTSPICVLLDNEEEPEWTTETGYIETHHLQLWFFATGLAAAEAAAVAGKNVFDWAKPQFLTARFLEMRRVGGGTSAEPIRSPVAELVAHWRVDYDLKLTRDYTPK